MGSALDAQAHCACAPCSCDDDERAMKGALSAWTPGALTDPFAEEVSARRVVQSPRSLASPRPLAAPSYTPGSMRFAAEEVAFLQPQSRRLPAGSLPGRAPMAPIAKAAAALVEAPAIRAAGLRGPVTPLPPTSPATWRFSEESRAPSPPRIGIPPDVRAAAQHKDTGAEGTAESQRAQSAKGCEGVLRGPSPSRPASPRPPRPRPATRRDADGARSATPTRQPAATVTRLMSTGSVQRMVSGPVMRPRPNAPVVKAPLATVMSVEGRSQLPTAGSITSWQDADFEASRSGTVNNSHGDQGHRDAMQFNGHQLHQMESLTKG